VEQEGEELGGGIRSRPAPRGGRTENDSDNGSRYAHTAAAFAKSLHPETQREAVRHAYQVMGRSWVGQC